MTKEEMLEKAIRDYPIGTKFHPAHLTGSDCVNTITNGTLETEKDGSEAIIERIGGRSVDGESGYMNIVCYAGRWARIISKPATTNIEYYEITF